MFVADRPPQLLFAVCIALLLLGGACVKGQTTNGRVHLTPADSVLAAKLGVAPHVLASASQLANRSPKEIVHLLEVNPSATLTASGAIVFGCGLHPQAEKEHHHHAPPDTPHPPKQQQHQPAVPASQPHNQAVWDEADTSKAFKLHSRPSATKKIFLEFQGCVTEGTAGWNNYYGVGVIRTPPYDNDGNTNSFSQDELRDIITIHAGVAEAYAGWDVDVTTENPGFDGIERTNEQDQHYGMRMCVGGTSSWTGTSIGGIATLNSFGWINKAGSDVYRDSFVFSSGLTDIDGKVNLGYVWKSINHEIGHTLGLVHKGFQTPNGVQEYYTIPPGVSLWAPVMGVPGRGLLCQWSQGEYPAEVDPSSNFDDELHIIQQTLPLLADEAGTSADSAQVLCKQSTCKTDGQKPGWVKTTVFGRVSQPLDQDWYKLTVATTEPFRIQLTVHNNWHQTIVQDGWEHPVTWRLSNLRPEVTFANKDVKVVPTAVDAWTWQQDFTVTVPKPGTYSFAIQPTRVLNGDGKLMPSTYGNLGSYQLMTSWPQQSATN